ncbi:LysR family transcriptional regulator [Rhodococcus opacus]|nr:LysR family transcriptional regulator [Rhodococcus opacus]
MDYADSDQSLVVNRVDQNLLISLRALLDLRHVTKAAERVHLSQPAMSAALRRLRRHFNDELLVRSGTGYELTPLGRRLQPLVTAAVQSLDSVWRESAVFDPVSSDRQFTITSSHYAAAVVLPGLRTQLAAQAPSVRVELQSMPRGTALSENEVLRSDLVICPLGYGLAGATRCCSTMTSCALSAPITRSHPAS